MISLELTASRLTNVNAKTDLSFDDMLDAYEQAENFTLLGFEVSTPKSSMDGQFTITVMH